MCCAYPEILQYMNVNNEPYNYGDSTNLNSRVARYSPLNDRHLEQVMRASRMTLRDINQGEEIIRCKNDAC
jgi:hypothetical protein